MHHPHPQWLGRQPKYRMLWQAGFILLSLALLHYVYLGGVSLCKFKDFDNRKQTQSLHFSTSTDTHHPPFGLFVDRNKTWHMYFQGWR
jgi:hypothetical protein